MLSKINAAYIAGVLDGEGCISVTRTHTSASARGCKRGYAYRSSIAVNMTDKGLVNWLRKTTGLGRVTNREGAKINHKPSFRWVVWSQDAATIAAEVLPYLKIKAKQARLLIQFQANMRSPGRSGLTDTEWTRRERTWDKFRQLNKRGL